MKHNALILRAMNAKHFNLVNIVQIDKQNLDYAYYLVETCWATGWFFFPAWPTSAHLKLW